MLIIVKFFIKFYKYIFSPFIPTACRFEPSCSQYALQALDKHGLLKGLWLVTCRLLRCHPWSGSCGYDPVPNKEKP